jgi:TPR repeat protein
MSLSSAALGRPPVSSNGLSQPLHQLQPVQKEIEAWDIIEELFNKFSSHSALLFRCGRAIEDSFLDSRGAQPFYIKASKAGHMQAGREWNKSPEAKKLYQFSKECALKRTQRLDAVKVVEAKDRDWAIAIYQAAAWFDHVPSQVKLALLLLEGADQQADEAVGWLVSAALQKDPEALYQLACLFDRGWQDPERGLILLRAAARQGFAEAQYSLARRYECGEGGVPCDSRLAGAWCQKAAEQGLAKAQSMLGECYDNGWGFHPDRVLALKWYQKAADQGLGEGAYYVGLCHEENEDLRLAVQSYTKAADQNYPYAFSRLAKAYRRGDGVEQDLQIARHYRSLYRASRLF